MAKRAGSTPRVHPAWLQFGRRWRRFVARRWASARGLPILHSIDTGTAGSFAKSGCQVKAHFMNTTACRVVGKRLPPMAALLAQRQAQEAALLAQRSVRAARG